jgi:hypothetical protein
MGPSRAYGPEDHTIFMARSYIDEVYKDVLRNEFYM